MTVSDWLVLVGGIAALLIAVVLLFVAVSRAVQQNGFFSGGLFRRPSAPLSLYALVLAAAAVIALFTWILLPRGT